MIGPSIPFLFFLLFFANVCHGLVETCEQLQAAFDLTMTQDVVVEMHPFQDIDCAIFTTMGMDSNTLTVKSSEDLSTFSGHGVLSEVRFEFTNGAKLIWETNVEFHGTAEHDVNGGGIFVVEGSTVRFLNNLQMTDVGVLSVTDESSDFASYELSGGCVYTDGYFRVDGQETFTHCDVSGGGESFPGPGGALYVGEHGSVMFNGAFEISDLKITDDEGNNGAGIYNRGKVNIKGNAKFELLRAETGGAIYNALGAQFRFRNGATSLFTDCTAGDGVGGALVNDGYVKFSGSGLFVNSVAPSIEVSSPGETVLSENSVFWNDEDPNDPAIFVYSRGVLDIPSSVSFIIGDVESDCSTVFYQEDGTCL